MRSFNIPDHFRSPIISRVKAKRKELDARKQDFSPATLDFGPVRIQLARHFGFCFGVENAIEISYKAIAWVKLTKHKAQGDARRLSR